MKKIIKPRTYKGTRDFLPEQMVKRQFVIEKIKGIFEKYGFEPLETPAIELMDTLGGKYGEEGDRLLYKFTDRGNREVGLRYDLTVPMARVVAMNPQLPKPFKRYQIQPVWRADKPQKGRFREFYQCDVDTVGADSLLADAEIISIIQESMNELNFSDFIIRVNNRKFLRSFIEVVGLNTNMEVPVIRAIDKLDKIGLDGVENELNQQGIEKEITTNLLKILDFNGNIEETFRHAEKYLGKSESGILALKETRELFKYLEQFGVQEHNLKFDLFLARGLDYYTGPIFETVVKEPRIGSVTGGGRYDHLIGLFTKNDLPAVGSSIGLERIITAMDELGMFPEHLKTPTQVLVTVFDESTREFSIRLTQELRKSGLNVNLYLGSSKLRGQLGYASEKGIPFVIIAGPDEIQQNIVTIKSLRDGKQEQVSGENVSDVLRKMINELFQS